MKLITVSAGVIALALASTASAVTMFGPATGVIAVLGSPKVVDSGGSGTAMFSSPVSIFTTTGDLTAASGTGTVMGTLSFSDTPGTDLPETVTDFMTFNDTTGGTFFFDVSSVTTVSYSSTASSTSIALYLLGVAGDNNLGEAGAPTSETLTLNRTGKSGFSASATINSPPLGVPEPATWALMMMGVAGMGAALRSGRRERALIAS